METLKDIVEELNKIPVDILEYCKFGIGENNEGTISLIIFDDDYYEIFETYPALKKLSNLIKNIIKAQEILNDSDSESLINVLNEEEGLTDTFFIDHKVSE